MPIEFPCAECSRQLRVPDDAAGGQAKCPECGAIAVVPEQHDAAPPPVEPPGPTEPAVMNPYAAPDIHISSSAQGNLFDDYRNSMNWATRGQRLAGAMIDGLINVAVALPGLLMMFIAIGLAEGDVESEPAVFIISVVVMGLGILGILSYQWYLISTTGQSLGKKAIGTRIVNYDNGGNPGFVHAVILRVWVPGLLGNVPYVGACFAWVNILWIFGEERRCLHDLIANTRVIKA